MFFRRFFNPTASAKIAREIYLLIVAKARQPYFYTELGVPDTVDGRFDMITLHAILVIELSLKAARPARRCHSSFSMRCSPTWIARCGKWAQAICRWARKSEEWPRCSTAAPKPIARRLHGKTRMDSPQRLGETSMAEKDGGYARRLARYALAAARSLRASGIKDIRADALKFPDPQKTDGSNEP